MNTQKGRGEQNKLSKVINKEIMYLCVYVCVHVYMCVCIHVFVYIHAHVKDS